VHPLTPEVWTLLCHERLIRPALVDAGRARVLTNNWPSAFDVADALLAGRPHLLAGIC
jgi:hypothetical protein